MRLPRPGAPQRRKAGPPMKLGGAEVSETRLKNGLRVIVAERHTDPVVASLLLFRVGSRNETERLAGVSHFLEHMMFKGTPTLGKGEVDRLTTELGGHNNAYTSQDHTAYWFELASDRWQTALEIDADRMQHLLLDPDEFESERSVVLEELAMGEDDPWRVLYRRAQAALFPRHSYRWPVIGYTETLRAMTVEDMRRHYEAFYTPGNATLVVSGDVTRSRAVSAARKAFGKIEARRPLPDSPFGVIEEPFGETRFEMRWDDSARRICMAWPTSPVCTDDDYALDMVATILSHGRLSRLQRRLVLDRSIATNLTVYNESWVESGGFWIVAECAQGCDPETLEAELDLELSLLATELVPAAELKRARSIILASEAYDSETVTDLGEEIGEYAVDADWRLAFDGGARHKKVTASRLRECVKRLLNPRRRVVGWCLPR